MSLRFLPPRLDLFLAAVLASKSSPLVDQSAYLQRKKYPVGCWLCISLSVSRPRTPLISLSLLPFAILILFRVAISYSPRLFGSLSITSLVNRFQAVHCAITHPPRFSPIPYCLCGLCWRKLLSSRLAKIIQEIQCKGNKMTHQKDCFLTLIQQRATTRQQAYVAMLKDTNRLTLPPYLAAFTPIADSTNVTRLKNINQFRTFSILSSPIPLSPPCDGCVVSSGFYQRGNYAVNPNK